MSLTLHSKVWVVCNIRLIVNFVNVQDVLKEGCLSLEVNGAVFAAVFQVSVPPRYEGCSHLIPYIGFHGAYPQF